MSVLLDEDTVVLEALDFEIPCAKCEQKAAFFVKCVGCNLNAGHLCAGHLTLVRLRLEGIVSMGITPVCAYCGRESKSFDTAYQVVKL